MTATLEKWTSTLVKFEGIMTKSSKTNRAVSIIFLLIAILLSFILTGWRTYIWAMQNPWSAYKRVYPRPNWLLALSLKILLYLVDSIGHFVFWYMFFYCMFLYGFFKLSNYAYFLLPGPDDQLWDHFLAWIIIVMIFKLISLYAKIYIQVNVDFYLLDQEKSDVSVHWVIRELK